MVTTQRTEYLEVAVLNLAEITHRVIGTTNSPGSPPTSSKTYGSGRHLSEVVDDTSELATLVRRVRHRDQDAWAELVTRFSPVVWTVARSFRLDPADCEDVCQLTWSRVVAGIDSLRQPERLGTWIVTTARREALRYLMQTRRNPWPADVTTLDWQPSGDASPEETVVARQQGAYLLKLFRELPEQHQLLMALLLSESAPSYDEISKILDIPRGSIGPTRNRILRRMREALNEATA